MEQFEFDVAISFAGEQRTEAEAIAERLKGRVKVFYDVYEKSKLWGKNLIDHLTDVYQHRARFCLMLISKDYVERAWGTQERQAAQARALKQTTEYILPVRFDNTEVPGLLDTVGYLNFKDEGVEGICASLLEKLNLPFEPATKLKAATDRKDSSDSDPPEYLEQRRRLPETEVTNKLYTVPRLRIWIRPTEFRKARFRDLDHCRQFVSASCVEIHASDTFPIRPRGSSSGLEWTGGETDIVSIFGSVLERWILFRSGQFDHCRAFRKIEQLNGGYHVLWFLDIVTAAFEFAARMAQGGFLSPEAAISFEALSVDGCALTWPQDRWGDQNAVSRDSWCQDDSFSLDLRDKSDNIAKYKRELALEAVIGIFSKFGWSDPPHDVLSRAQSERFGDAAVPKVEPARAETKKEAAVTQRTLGKLIPVLAGMLPATADTFPLMRSFWRTKLFEYGFPDWVVDAVVKRKFDWSAIIPDLYGAKVATADGVPVASLLCNTMLLRLVNMALQEAVNRDASEKLRVALRSDGFDISSNSAGPFNSV